MTMDTPPEDNGTPPTPPPEPPTTTAPPPPPPEAAPAPPAGEDSGNKTVMIVLSYLGLLALIPFFVEKNDAEVQWHAKHGLVLTVVEFVLLVGLQIVAMVLGAVSGGLGCLIGILFPILLLGILIVHIICIAKGLKGERFIIPMVSEYADKF